MCGEKFSKRGLTFEFYLLILRYYASLHKGLVHNNVEYDGVLWNARASRAKLRAVDKLQMRELDMVDGMNVRTYEEQLIALNLTTLS